MVSFLFKVEHGHCALCQAKRPLFVLYLESGQPPKLLPKPDNVHSAICWPCWKEIGKLLLYPALDLAPYKYHM